MKKEKIQKIFNESKSKSEVCKKMGYHVNGTGFRKLQKIIDEFDIDISNLSVNLTNSKIKYKRIKKICPVCNTEFETKKNHVSEKTTCSHKCSNTFFRSGVDNPNWKNDTYRSTCFLYHEHKCVICDEDKILDVHHFDLDRNNNNPNNLIPLCPTHHMYYHSRYKDEVESQIIKYRNVFLNKKLEYGVTR
jgi:hypothetical protein